MSLLFPFVVPPTPRNRLLRHVDEFDRSVRAGDIAPHPCLCQALCTYLHSSLDCSIVHIYRQLMQCSTENRG